METKPFTLANQGCPSFLIRLTTQENQERLCLKFADLFPDHFMEISHDR